MPLRAPDTRRSDLDLRREFSCIAVSARENEPNLTGPAARARQTVSFPDCRRRWNGGWVTLPTRSVEVERIPELHPEPDQVLIRVDLLRRRGPARALLKEPVAPEHADESGDLIVRREAQCQRLGVDAPRRLSAAHGLRHAVDGAEDDEEVPQGGNI